MYFAPVVAMSRQVGANEKTRLQTSPGIAPEARLRASLRDGPQISKSVAS
jgi:hypothetical protein